MNIKSIPPASVLFVDDEEKARKYFALAMASDFDVKTAGSAAEAMDILARDAGQIAIIVSDQRMPEKTGVELLKSVRDYYPNIVRLLTTAYTDLDDAIEAINRGEILRYIQKPWDINTLKTELKQALNYFQLRSERDSLLEEKLSVKQRMVQIERVTQLLLLAETIPYLRFTGQAVRRYIDLVANTALSSGESLVEDQRRLDLWSQTLGETARMQHFIKAVTTELNECLPVRTEFNTRLDFPALHNLLEASAREVAVSIDLQRVNNPAVALSVDLPLCRLMLVKLFSTFHRAGGVDQSRPVRISLAAEMMQPSAGLRLSFELPEADFSALPDVLTGPVAREIPQPCADLLVAIFACLHHGGSLESGASAGQGRIELCLPGDPALARVAPASPDWHENLLLSFEPDIY